MQILRRLVSAGVAATFFTPIFLHAYDNEAQIRARQALEQKMNQLDAQPVTTNAAPPPAASTKPKPAATKPAVKPQPAAQASAPQPQKKAPPAAPVTPEKPPQQVPPAQTAAKPAPAVKPAPSTAVAVKPAPSKPGPAKAETSAAPTYSALPTAGSTDSQTSTRLDTALNTKMMQTEPAPAVSASQAQTSEPWNQPFTPVQQHASAKTQASPSPTMPAAEPLHTIAAPPTGLSASKQEKLDHLLQLYRADQITPQEYHEQRAKILAEQ